MMAGVRAKPWSDRMQGVRACWLGIPNVYQSGRGSWHAVGLHERPPETSVVTMISSPSSKAHHNIERLHI